MIYEQEKCNCPQRQELCFLEKGIISALLFLSYDNNCTEQSVSSAFKVNQ